MRSIARHLSGMPPDTTTTIRPATAGDAAALAELGRRTFIDTFAADNTPEDMAAFLDGAYSPALQARELADPLLTYLVAERDGTLVGFSLLRRGRTCAFTTDASPHEVQRFYVDASCHGSGLAHRLMERTVAEAHGRGARTLFLGVFERNARAIRFYEKQGFTRAGTQVFTVGTDDQTDAVMVRTLD